MEGVVAQKPPSSEPISRRRLLRLWGPAAVAGVALGGAGGLLYGRAGRHRPPIIETVGLPPDWRTPGAENPALSVAGGSGPAANLQAALAALGGIDRFISPGERVVIKPNCAWDRTPEQAANTNPELIGELVRACLEAGAAAVVVAENTCHDPNRVLARSGVADAARKAGAKVVHQKNTKTVVLDLGGTALGRWEVLRPIAEADRVINVPIVKHHSLCQATLGMKNWMGALVGRRNSLHQNINQVCAELGAAFRPTLTVVDATRALTGGGPTGGSLDLVRPLDLIAVSTDPVAADAWGGSLLELGTHELRFLAIAERLGLGTPEWRQILVEA
jgi:uncharacterized protein (DUF362 family)